MSPAYVRLIAILKNFNILIIDYNLLATEEVYNISRESLYMESFKHKNIVRCLNSYVFENKIYSVMDCAMGGELGAYIKERHHLTENDAIRIFKQIHDAVKYIHSRNVVHRDIKPNNILFLDEKHENIIVFYL